MHLRKSSESIKSAVRAADGLIKRRVAADDFVAAKFTT